MTSARLAKLLAVVLVALALWRARPPAAPARVAVLALPGAPEHVVSAPLPRVAEGSDAGAGAAYWRRLFALEDDGHADPATLPPLWSADPSPVRTLDVPARLFSAVPDAADAETAFAGTSAGAVVEASDLTAGRLPSPYDRAVEAVVAAAAQLRRDEWSDWIHVDAAPPGSNASAPRACQFQFTRSGESSYFFSPAYVAGPGDVLGEPFLRGIDRELRPLAAAHLLGLSKRRLEGAAGLFAKDADDQRPVVVFDPVAESVARVFAPDTVPASIDDQVMDAIAADISALREAVGGEGLVVVVGGPTTARHGGPAAWARTFAGGASRGLDGAGKLAASDVEAARAVVRYVSGVALAAGEKAAVPVELAARFPIRPTMASPKVPLAPGDPARDWSVATIESIPGAVTTGR